MFRKSLIAALGFLTLFACQKDKVETGSTITGISDNIEELDVPFDFDYSTSNKVSVDIMVYGLNDQPLNGVKVSFYDQDPDEGGEMFANTVTNPAGIIETVLSIPSYLDSIFVRCHTVGFANAQVLRVQQNLNIQFGGKPEPRTMVNTKSTSGNQAIPISSNYYYFGTFRNGNNNGLPDYLEPTGDNISQDFLDDVNASLPEGYPVPVYNSSYLATSNELDVVLSSMSDVWITFVTEGAGHKNSLGYYVYDTDNPPQSAAQIDSIFIVLPNASLQSAGGRLQAGDKVHLGAFPGGKTISWVLFSNAWSNRGVDVNATKFYSNSDFNPESTASTRQHSVQLVDNSRQLLLNGFEDLNRDNGSDDDFNDLIFYVSSNPWTSVEVTDVPNIAGDQDTDGDGVSDESDDYPNDALRATSNFFTGTLTFEDLWPSKGDYDFNDLVVDYDIAHVLNSANKIVEIDAEIIVKAIGGSYSKGLGFQFENITDAVINSVSGINLEEGLVTTNANGTEAGQSKATVIVFDDAFNQIANLGTSFVNTIESNPYAEPDTQHVLVTFTTPQEVADVGVPPYNAFIFVNNNRGREIHLTNHAPTDLADLNLLGTSNDVSNPTTGDYYKTENNLPWALNVDRDFDHTVEYEAIDDGYLYFSSWAVSAGNNYQEWYGSENGYRNSNKIYSKHKNK